MWESSDVWLDAWDFFAVCCLVLPRRASPFHSCVTTEVISDHGGY